MDPRPRRAVRLRHLADPRDHPAARWHRVLQGCRALLIQAYPVANQPDNLAALRPYVPIGDSVRMSVAILSYVDTVSSGITADYESSPRPGRLHCQAATGGDVHVDGGESVAKTSAGGFSGDGLGKHARDSTVPMTCHRHGGEPATDS